MYIYNIILHFRKKLSTLKMTVSTCALKLDKETQCT